jgi:alpha-tubulin suppressor-like RCC1 family protein
VVVKDASGNPVPDVAVTFTGTSGGGTLTGASQSTNSSGVATLGGWTLPTAAGQYTVNAAATGIAGTGVTFAATANPDAPNAMQPSGGGQSMLYGSRLATPLQVRVVDQYGNPTPGVVVTWGSFTGAGTVEPIDVATDASGIVRSNYRLGTVPGANVVRASITSRSLSVDFSATALGFTNEIGLSSHHGCALDETGVAHCWGQNDYGQVGDGTTTNRLAPVAVGGALRFRRIVVGWGISCALTTDYVGYCWGTNGAGALGDGTRTNRSVPTAVSGGHRFKDISTGNGSATCGVTLAGAAYCWGSNNIGQLGVGTGAALDNCADPATLTSAPCTLVPMQIAGGHTFASVTTNGTHTCALTPAGELYCWGFISNYGGNFREVPDWAPFRVASGFTFAMVNAGDFHTCGIVSPSSAYCWGNAVDGNLGNGLDEALQETPALVPNIAATQIDGGHGTCAVATDKRAFCWGSNAYGAIGNGTTTGGLAPTPVSSNLPFTAISTSGYATCARVENGQVYCWGYNAQGQLGVGDVFSRLTPALTRP